MSSTPLIQVFVYGTLKPGGVYHQPYCGDKVIQVQPAIAQGSLYHLPLGYPAMTPGSGKVQGFVLSFQDAAVLEKLDQLEGYDPHNPPDWDGYDRRLIETFHPEGHLLDWVWAYLMAPEQVKKLGGVYLPDGHWDLALQNR